jgi:hypothetical protein
MLPITDCKVSNISAPVHQNCQQSLRLLAFMRRRLKIVRKRSSDMDDLSFPPPYNEQAKYLELANEFLSPSRNAERDAEKVQSIEAIRKFRESDDDEKAA